MLTSFKVQLKNCFFYDTFLCFNPLWVMRQQHLYLILSIKMPFHKIIFKVSISRLWFIMWHVINLALYCLCYSLITYIVFIQQTATGCSKQNLLVLFIQHPCHFFWWQNLSFPLEHVLWGSVWTDQPVPMGVSVWCGCSNQNAPFFLGIKCLRDGQGPSESLQTTCCIDVRKERSLFP